MQNLAFLIKTGFLHLCRNDLYQTMYERMCYCEPRKWVNIYAELVHWTNMPKMLILFQTGSFMKDTDLFVTHLLLQIQNTKRMCQMHALFQKFDKNEPCHFTKALVLMTLVVTSQISHHIMIFLRYLTSTSHFRVLNSNNFGFLSHLTLFCFRTA